ncbi:hypothetical protein [Bradyrhizobium sp.]|uniref:hypothetical protein n=1 Tax=Bradyrhizobium sp. TaxID=376 RepID=UPI002C128AB7|nr:hypothetical protein [Bradyrhizobium sp.]HMM88936.1 hypothetical protein [Bradyrhizobium sp.]
MTATRTGKIAAALAALLFAYILKSTILDYATEPKVIGGIDFDKPIPQAMPWTPVYYPMLLSMAFAYWIWPTKAYARLGGRMAAGCFAILRASCFAMYISFFCAGFGEFYLTFPLLMKVEILPALAGVFVGALGATAMFGLFFVQWFIVFSIFFGCLIALVVHAVSRGSPPPLPDAA